MRNVNDILNLKVEKVDERVQKTLNKEGLNIYYENFKFQIENKIKQYLNLISKVENLQADEFSKEGDEQEYEFIPFNKLTDKFIENINGELETDLVNIVHSLLNEFCLYYQLDNPNVFNYWSNGTTVYKVTRKRFIEEKIYEDDVKLHDFIYRMLKIEDNIEDDKFNKFVKDFVKDYPNIERKKNKITMAGQTGSWADDYYSRKQLQFIEAVHYFLTGKFKITHSLGRLGGYNVSPYYSYKRNIDKGKHELEFEKLPMIRTYANTKIDFFFKDELTAQEFIDTMTNFR